jgi:hypothetical protein
VNLIQEINQNQEGRKGVEERRNNTFALPEESPYLKIQAL